MQGLEIAHFHDLADAFVPAGVFVTGTAHHVALRGLEVHDIRTATADAHGIAVYGTSGDAAIHDVTIERNSVHDNHLGSSESVVVNGNVRDWSITRNRIFRNDNIGIDAIGFEGKAPRNDQARDGHIADNSITDIDSLGNPAYDEEGGGNCRCADGIYVDGGRDLLIERNVVLRSNIALEIASEHSFGSATNVLARDNVLADSTTIGLAIGGYDTERGQTIDARVVNNTFVNNDTLGTGSGEILLQYRVYDSQILNNVVVANAQATMIANPYVENAGNVVDGNAWWVVGAPPPTATWQWKTLPTTASRATAAPPATTRTAWSATRCWARVGGRGPRRRRSTPGSTRRWRGRSTCTAPPGAKAVRSTSAPWSERRPDSSQARRQRGQPVTAVPRWRGTWCRAPGCPSACRRCGPRTAPCRGGPARSRGWPGSSPAASRA